MIKILASLLIVLAIGATGCARRTVVYEPAASPPTAVVTTPAPPGYVIRYDNKAACQAAGGRWHGWANRCDF